MIPALRATVAVVGLFVARGVLLEPKPHGHEELTPYGHELLDLIYSPSDHPMTPSDQKLQYSLERFNGKSWLPDGSDRSDLPAEELFTRHFPVETRFFASYGGPKCDTDAAALPPSQIGDVVSGNGDAEPKFACGPIASLQRKKDCRIFSVGSNAQTAFESYVHEQAPNCKIEVFDPTLGAKALHDVQRLEEKGVFHFHPFGLSDKNGNMTIKMGNKVVKFPVRTLATLYDRVDTTWVDYLKIDCEGCEFDAIPQFFQEATKRWGAVPVTQLQVEVHVPGASPEATEAWAAATAVPAPGGNASALRVKGPYADTGGHNRQARELLGLMEQYGFVPFHIDFTRHKYKCCGVEYTFLNTRAPKDVLQMLGAPA